MLVAMQTPPFDIYTLYTSLRNVRWAGAPSARPCYRYLARHAAILTGGGRRYNAGMSADRFSRMLLKMQFVVCVVYGFLAGLRHWPAGVAFGVLASLGLRELRKL